MHEQQKPIWCVVVAMSNQQMTEAAVGDLLAQSVPTRVLLVLQGVAGEFRNRMEAIAEQESRLLVWVHDPSLPSLSATWNRALRFVWEIGGEEALVVNNDVRLHPQTVGILDGVLGSASALFVSAVGVTEEQYHQSDTWFDETLSHGGPDFSCFLLSRAGHEKYPFDELFIPAYGEDCDTHRRYMLGGDGERIFSVNLPYWHIGGGSNTLKSLEPEARAKLERTIGKSREYYARKWGSGGINHETLTIPFDEQSAQAGVTNPELQRAIQEAEHVPAN